MPWSTPITWVTGDLVTSGRLNAHLADNANFLRGNGTDGRADYRMSGTIAGYAPATPTVLGAAALWGTVIWDSTGFLDTVQPRGGGTPPWDYIPEPTGIDLLVARANTIAGGTLATWLTFQSESGEVPVMTGGSVPITGYQISAAALHRFTGNKMRVYARHGGVGGSIQGIGMAIDVHQLQATTY